MLKQRGFELRGSNYTWILFNQTWIKNTAFSGCKTLYGRLSFHIHLHLSPSRADCETWVCMDFDIHEQSWTAHVYNPTHIPKDNCIWYMNVPIRWEKDTLWNEWTSSQVFGRTRIISSNSYKAQERANNIV